MSGFKSAFFNHKNEMFGKIQNWSVLTCIFVPVATKATAALLTEQEGRRPWLILMKTAHWLFFLPPIRMETPHSWVFSKLANFKAFRVVFHFPVRYSVLHYFKPLYTLCIKRITKMQVRQVFQTLSSPATFSSSSWGSRGASRLL